MATTLEIDAVIDPAATRPWLLRGLDSAPPPPRRQRGAAGAMPGRFVDPW